MGMMDKIKSLWPWGKKDNNQQQEIKNNTPKEKENMRKSFAVYCNANHGTKDNKLCAKCNAVLMRIMQKYQRCPYGIAKPICDKCEIMCFGEKDNKTFMDMMSGSRKKMLMKHPVMTVKHKLIEMGVDYARDEQQKKDMEKAEGKRKQKAAKAKARAEQNKK